MSQKGPSFKRPVSGHNVRPDQSKFHMIVYPNRK